MLILLELDFYVTISRVIADEASRNNMIPFSSKCNKICFTKVIMSAYLGLWLVKKKMSSGALHEGHTFCRGF